MHILMIPAPFFGHIIPLLELGKKIASIHRVTFAAPAYLMDDIKKRNLLSSRDTNIHLLGVTDGFPPEDPTKHKPGALTTNGAIQLLDGYTLLLRSILVSLVNENKPEFAIIDNFLSHLGALFRAEKIRFYHFNTAAAESMLLKGILFNENCPVWFEEDGAFPVWSSSEDTTQPLPQFEKDIFENIKKSTSLAEGVIINGAVELEPDVMNKLRKHPTMDGRKVFFLGPLIPDEKTSEESKFFSEWLDNKKANSVVYISLGSVAAAVPKPEQLTEMAYAFLSMQQPFIWSLPSQFHANLPESLKNRIEEQLNSPSSPFLIVRWAPQKLILSHAGTSVFVSHCGWNSTLETMSNGVPIIGWPLFADQGLNAHSLVQKGMGVVIDGTGMKAKRVVPASEIVYLVRKVTDDVSYRINAQTWMKTLLTAVKDGGSSHTQFLQFMESLS